MCPIRSKHSLRREWLEAVVVRFIECLCAFMKQLLKKCAFRSPFVDQIAPGHIREAFALTRLGFKCQHVI